MNNRVPDKGVFGLDWNGERRSVPYSIAMFVHGSLKETGQFFWRENNLYTFKLSCAKPLHYVFKKINCV